MPYDIEIDDKCRIVCVRLSGRIPRGEHLAARDRAVALCREHGIKRLLVDLREMELGRDITTGGCYSFGEKLAEDSQKIGLKIAHVLPRIDPARRDAHFTSTVAANRGAITMEFGEEDEARKWLTGE